jgi:hypothetical protein
MLQPYERLVEIADSPQFIQEVKEGKISKIWVQDTKGKRWCVSKEKMKHLRETTDFL